MKSIYNPCELTISTDFFNNLSKSGTQWTYIDASYYRHHNITQKYKINQKNYEFRGIFRCVDANLEKLLGSYAMNLIIKCNYAYINENKIKMSLVPMALLSNMPLEQVEHIFNALFKKTAYYKSKIKEEKLLDTKNDVFFITRFNAIRIFLSLYVSSKFRRFISRLLDYQITINYDVLNEIEPNEKCRIALISWIDQALKWNTEDFIDKVRNLTIKFISSLRYSIVSENRLCEYDKIRNDTEGLIAKLYINMVQERKVNPENAFFTIEQARGVMFDYSKLSCDKVDDLRLTDYAILNMLEMEYFKEDLRINNSCSLILVGYTCGKNFDYMFPYQNIYMQLILKNLHDYCHWFWFNELKKEEGKYTLNLEDNNVKEIFIRISPSFLRQAMLFFKEQNYWDVFVSSKEFEFYQIYFRCIHHNTFNITSLLMAFHNCTDIDDILQIIFSRWSYGMSRTYEDEIKDIILQKI